MEVEFEKGEGRMMIARNRCGPPFLFYKFGFCVRFSLKKNVHRFFKNSEHIEYIPYRIQVVTLSRTEWHDIFPVLKGKKKN